MKQVLYFTADWCVPCKKVRPIVEEMSRENPEIGFVFIDSEIEKNLAEIFHVKSIPTFILIEKGIPTKRMTGAKTKDELWGFINDEKTIQEDVQAENKYYGI